MIGLKLFLGAIQWMAFFIAASIAVPIAIAQAFELNQVQSAELIQSTFFSLGLGDGAVFMRSYADDQ